MRQLENEVDDDAGDDDQCRTGEHDLPRGGQAVGDGQLGDRDHQRVLGVGAQEQDGPEEVVPAGDERERRPGGQRGLHDGHHDAPEDPELAAAVDARGVDDFIRHGEHVLAQVEDTDGRRHTGDDQRPEAVDHAHPSHDDEQRDGARLRADHHGGDDEIEQRVSAGEAVLGEGKPGQRAEKQRGDGSDDGGEQAV